MTPIHEFVYHRRVQYRDTDVSGLVHFSTFFAYAEEAEHAMWRAAGLSVEPGHGDIGWPRVAASFEFFKALRFEDEIAVHVRVTGRTAKTLQYQMVIQRGGEVAAIGSLTAICVRKIAGQPLRAIDIPESIAARFELAPPVEPPRRAASPSGS